MKITMILAALAVGSVAMGNAPISSSPNLNLIIHTEKLSAELPDYVAPKKLEFFYTPPKFESKQLETRERKPLATSLFWATDKQAYSVTSTVWEPDFRGLRGVDAVALAGFRLNGSVPVWGGGLEWSGETKIITGVYGYASLLFGGLWEQNDALDEMRGFGALNIGFRFMKF